MKLTKLELWSEIFFFIKWHEFAKWKYAKNVNTSYNNVRASSIEANCGEYENNSLGLDTDEKKIISWAMLLLHEKNA